MAKVILFSFLTVFLFIQVASSQEVLKVGSIPIIHELAIHTAQTKGYLAQEGINVEFQIVPGGAVAIPAIVGGSLQVAHSSYVAVIKARDAGFDISVVFPYSKMRPDSDADAIMVRVDSPIVKPKDLEGRTVALNVVKDVAWLKMVEWLVTQTVDPKKVNFVEIPPHQMAGVLRAGSVDAVAAIEPFITPEVEKGGIRIIDNPRFFTAVQGLVEVSGLVSKESWIRANRDTVERLARALRRATDYINQNPQEWGSLATGYTRLKPELIAKIIRPELRYPLEVAVLQKSADLSLKWGLIKKKQDVREFVWPTALR